MSNTSHVLVRLEISGIQSFIFGTNKLQIANGASRLVKKASTEWVTTAIKDVGLEANDTIP